MMTAGTVRHDDPANSVKDLDNLAASLDHLTQRLCEAEGGKPTEQNERAQDGALTA